MANSNKIFKQDLEKFSSRLEKAFFTVMRENSAELLSYLTSGLSKTGEVYGGKRTSSPPYSMPYKVSSNLLDSTEVEYEEHSSRAVIRAGTDTIRTPYARYLEYGTAFMLPRPYLLPAGILFFNKICRNLKNLKGKL